MSNNDFKVGDIVQIRFWEDMEEEFGLSALGNIKCRMGFTKTMRNICGTVVQINHIEPTGKMIFDLTYETKNKDIFRRFCITRDMIRRL